MCTPKRSHPQRRQSLLRIAACGTALGAAGCQGITPDSPEAAQVRFVQVSPEAPALDMYFDNNGAAYNLSFGTVTSYVSLRPGEYRLSAHRGGTGQALVSGQAVLGVAKQYTAIVSNTLGSLQETVVPDTNTPAPPGTVAVRVLNEAALGGPADVYLVPSGGSPATANLLVRDLPFGSAGTYEHLPADKTYTVVVVPAGGPTRRANGLGTLTLTGASGAVRTVIVADLPSKANKAFTALVLNDYDAP